MWRWGKREIIYLSLYCHRQNDSCIKVGNDESHFNVLLIVRDKVTRQCPQTTTFEEKGEPKRIRTEVPLLISLAPYRKAKPAHAMRAQLHLLLNSPGLSLIGDRWPLDGKQPLVGRQTAGLPRPGEDNCCCFSGTSRCGHDSEEDRYLIY